MDLVVLNRADIRTLLPMTECIDLMSRTLKTLAAGKALQPLRTILEMPEGQLALMPAWLGDAGVSGVKAVSVYFQNQGTELETHQGAVLLFEAERGRPLAVLEASEVTAIRTAAVSAVATLMLAREDVTTLAILGSGVQASSHLDAMRAVRPISTVRVWSRNPDRAEQFAKRQAQKHGIAVDAVYSAREAVAGAGIVCTTTAAEQPVLEGAWLEPGMHINAVGACAPHVRELDTDAITRSRLYTDRIESLVKEAGDFIIPRDEGKIDNLNIAGELGEVLLGQVDGRGSDSEITLFKSLGIGVMDVASAAHVHRKATDLGVGQRIEWP